MHPLHQQIISLIKSKSQVAQPDFEGFGIKYVGSDKKTWHLKTSDIEFVAKEFLKNNKLSDDEILAVTNSLYENGSTFDELVVVAKILQRLKDFRSIFNPTHLISWLSYVHGWAETDVLCQMVFDADNLLENWDKWHKVLTKLNQDENIHKRRASLVLLTKPVRQSADPKLSELAFYFTDQLKLEKHILITKAVSWILRSLIKNHRDEVERYLESNLELLPKIALREVRSKLDTGKKYINKKRLN